MKFIVAFLIFQYKKHGYVNKIRLVIVYSLLLFLINAYYLVILPLPNISSIHPVKKSITEYMQLIPFTFIFDFLKETKIQLNEPSTYLMILGYILYKTIKNDKILFYERISGTKNVVVYNEKDILKEENIDFSIAGKRAGLVEH